MEGRGPGYSSPAKGENGVREIAVVKRIPALDVGLYRL
jgi:hypothetical protein